jgi:hypothetical protein
LLVDVHAIYASNAVIVPLFPAGAI